MTISVKTAMGMIARSWLLATALLLGGCGTAEKRAPDMTADLSGLVGKTSAEVIAARGAPTRSTAAPDGGKTLEYTREHLVRRPGGTTVVVAVANTGTGAPVPIPQTIVEPPSVITFTCKLTLRFSAKDLLESWKVEGNDC